MLTSLTVCNNVTCISSARQRLAKHVPERYAITKNRRSLLDNAFSYHRTNYGFGTMEAEPFKVVISTRFAGGYNS
jgi:hypothetical protein